MVSQSSTVSSLMSSLHRLAHHIIIAAASALTLPHHTHTRTGTTTKGYSSGMARVSRLARELELLRTDPPPGVSAWLVDEADLSRFHASKCDECVVGLGRAWDEGKVSRKSERACMTPARGEGKCAGVPACTSNILLRRAFV